MLEDIKVVNIDECTCMLHFNRKKKQMLNVLISYDMVRLKKLRLYGLMNVVKSQIQTKLFFMK